MRLMNTHSVVFTRTGTPTEKPRFNSTGRAVHPDETSEITATGSLQPYSTMNNRLPLPEGVREEDCRIFYSKDDLRTVEQFNNNLADKAEIEGKWYKVMRKGPWQGFKTRVDHYEYYLELIQPKGK